MTLSLNALLIFSLLGRPPLLGGIPLGCLKAVDLARALLLCGQPLCFGSTGCGLGGLARSLSGDSLLLERSFRLEYLLANEDRACAFGLARPRALNGTTVAVRDGNSHRSRGVFLLALVCLERVHQTEPLRHAFARSSPASAPVAVANACTLARPPALFIVCSYL